MKKGGKMHIFPRLVKSMYIVSPIDLKFAKLQKKGLKFFTYGAHHLNIINFQRGKNMNQEGGGGKNMNF